MNDIDFTYLLSRINQEGFDYCFRKYSSFKEFEDPDFHRLREQYIEAADCLQNYIQQKANEEFFCE